MFTLDVDGSKVRSKWIWPLDLFDKKFNDQFTETHDRLKNQAGQLNNKKILT